MKKRLSVILSFVLVACMLTAVFAFTASADAVTPTDEVVTPIFAWDFESAEPTVGSHFIGTSNDAATAARGFEVATTPVEESEEELEPANETAPNKYGKLYPKKLEASGTPGSYRFEFKGATDTQLNEASYIVLEMDIGSENGYFTGADDATSLYFNTRNASGAIANGSSHLYITRRINQWYINGTNGDAYVVADNNEWFHLTLIIDVIPDAKGGYGDSVGYVLINGVNTGITFKAFGDESAYIQTVRVNTNADKAQTSLDRSYCFDNIKLDSVVSNEGDRGSLAWLAYNDQPLTEWTGLVYNEDYAMPEEFRPYDGMPKALWYTVKGSSVTEYYTTKYSDLSSVLNQDGDIEIHFLADFIIANETASATTGPQILTLSKSGTKNFYMHGHTLMHNPQYQGQLARGHFFDFPSSVNLTLNFYGGTEEEGMGTLARVASAQSMFKSYSRNNLDNVKINMYGMKVTNEGSTAGYISDGNMYGTDFYFEDCDLYFRDFEVTSSATSAGTDASSVVFKDCDIYVDAKQIKFSGANTTAIFENCNISSSGVAAILFATNANSVVITGDSVIDVATLSNSNAGITIGAGVRVANMAVLNGVKYESGVYLTANSGENATDYPYAVESLPFMANLTLYSDFTYNLYIPTNIGVTAVNGVDVATLETDTVLGVECYIYQIANIKATDVASDIELTVSYMFGEELLTTTAKVSVLDYAAAVLASTDSKVVKAQGLIVDMLQYVDEAYKYFDEENGEVAALLEGRVPTEYTPTETEVCDPSALNEYIKGAYISLEGNCPKYVIEAKAACRVTVSYVTLDGSIVRETRGFANDQDTLEIELRAYDMYKTLTIDVEAETPDGAVALMANYDLYTYIYTIANDEDVTNDDCLSLLEALYTFSKSAENYRLGR